MQRVSFYSFTAKRIMFKNLSPKLLSICLSSVLLATAGSNVASAQVDVQSLADYASIDRALLDTAITEAVYQQKIIDTMTRPYESKPWFTYRKLFMTDQRIQGGVDFYIKHEATLKRAQEKLGVPPEIVCAIIGVETFYGKNMGTWRVLDALYTLGFHYPPREAYFSKEFANFIKLSQQQNWNFAEIKGSYAGAMGMGQFMPSSYLNHAIDFNNDGHINLFADYEDAIGSVANYFKNHGWKAGGGVMYPVHVKGVSQATLDSLMAKEWKLTPNELYQAGASTKVNLSNNQTIRLYKYELADGTFEYQAGLNNFKAITLYNKSPLYARVVYELAEAIALNYQERMVLQGQYIQRDGRNP